MGEDMECMCVECGISTYLPLDYIKMEDLAATDSKMIDSLIVCQNCGGQLKLVGKAGDEPEYRLE